MDKQKYFNIYFVRCECLKADLQKLSVLYIYIFFLCTFTLPIEMIPDDKVNRLVLLKHSLKGSMNVKKTFLSLPSLIFFIFIFFFSFQKHH